LKEDVRLMVTAASVTQRAADFILVGTCDAARVLPPS
jgi:hypothetical protein